MKHFLFTLILPIVLYPAMTTEVCAPVQVAMLAGIEYRWEEPLTAYRAEPMPSVEAYIYVNIDEMAIEVWHEGSLLYRDKVLSVRNIGSKFDTPRGLFSILTKEDLHFSSIGHVWMPYSMQFSGDFFIHGWPYYLDGTPVPEGYSGGCVRLSDDVAKQVYEYAEIGMPVLIE